MGQPPRRRNTGRRSKKDAGRSGSTPPESTPRAAALSILNTVSDDGRPLDDVLASFFETAPPFDRRDVNLIHALVFGVLRHRATLDHLIGHFSKRPLRKIDPGVRNILRIAIFQIRFMDRIPDAAAVNTAVDITKSRAPRWVAGFVNGLLRAAVRAGGHASLPDMENDPAAALAVEKSFPEWLVRRWLARWGAETTARLCDAVNRIPPITLRVNPLRTDRRRLMAALSPETASAEPTPFSPDGVMVVGLSAAIDELSAFRQGLFQVQDEAAQLVSHLLGPKPGETVLDACAGLGGKTGHLAGLMQNQGRIVALDRYPRKLSRLNQEMKRLGASIVSLLCHDLEAPPPFRPAAFDRILLDAPCSGLGVLGRNPDGKWSSAKRDLAGYGRRQLRFLARLAPLVKPSGILGYAVCSMEPEEGPDVAAAFLDAHPEFAMQRDTGHLPAGARALAEEDGSLRTLPHRHRMDGFFSVCFVRKI